MCAILFTLVGLLAVTFYWLFVRPLGIWKKKGVPYPKGLPVFGNFFEISIQRKSITTALQEFYHKFSNERYFGIIQFHKPMLLIRDPELMKQICTTDFDKFRDHSFGSVEDSDPIWTRNLLNIRGEKWHGLRSTLSPTFTGSKMRAMFVLMEGCAKSFVDYFDTNDYVEIEFKDTFSRFANDVIASCAFGVQCDSLRQPKNDFFLKGLETTDFSGIRVFRLLGQTLYPRLVKFFGVGVFTREVEKFFKQLLKDSIAVRKERKIVRHDMIQILVDASKDDKFGVLSSDIDITAQVLVFFFAGFDTISSSLAFLQYELAVNPEVQDKLYKEINTTMKECDGNITYDILMKMKYLDMVINEALRKWPINIIVDRLCTTAYTIEPKLPHEKPLTIEPETIVWMLAHAISMDPKYYKDPEKFDPERFEDSNASLPGYAPFGIGPRMCIGNRFALMEMKILTVMLLYKFEVVPTKKTQIPAQLSPKHFPMTPNGGMWLGLKKRSNKL